METKSDEYQILTSENGPKPTRENANVLIAGNMRDLHDKPPSKSCKVCKTWMKILILISVIIFVIIAIIHGKTIQAIFRQYNAGSLGPTASPTPSPTTIPMTPPTTPPPTSPLPTTTPSKVPTALSPTATTNIPTRNPTQMPTDTTSNPTLIPTKSPTLSAHPTKSPSNIPTRNPTLTPSISPTTKLEAFSSVKSDEIVIAVVWQTAVAFSIFFLLIAMIYMVRNSKQISGEHGTGSLCQTFEATGWFQKLVTPILNIIDIITDFLFASNILLTYRDNQILSTFGWISLLAGIFGVVLFIGKLLLMKKLMFRITTIKNNRNFTQNQIIQKIRRIKSHISFYDLTITAIEDCPQLAIVIMISRYLGFADIIGVIQFCVTALSFIWTPFSALFTILGCCDNTVVEYPHAVINNHINNDIDNDEGL